MPTPERADLVLRGGVLFVSGPTHGGCGVAVGGGKILYAGPDAGLAPFIGRRTEVVDLGGAMVLPGFHDCHCHPLIGGLDLSGCDLLGLASAEAYEQAVRDWGSRNSAAACIRGSGWLYRCFPPGGPDKKPLDAAVGSRPAYLKAVDGHSAWVNAAALALAGITRDTPDPPGGRIERDPATGEPSGTLRELSAMHLVEHRLPGRTPAEYADALDLFLRRAAAAGITSACDAMALPEYLAACKALDDAGRLTVRMHAAVVCDPQQGTRQAPELLELCKKHTGRRLQVDGAKFFLDGTVEGHTALLLEPYADRPGFRGEAIWNAPALGRAAAELDACGLQLHFHAVGDAAVRMALDAIEHAGRANGGCNARHRVAHCDLVADSDLPRFARLGAVADMQPSWFYHDSFFHESTLPYLGRARAYRLYRMQSLLDAGAVVACGSDWPVGGDTITLSPLAAIQIGVTRLALDSAGGDAYLPGEAVQLWSMLDCYTGQAAMACRQEHRTGTIEAGRYADLVVVDRNLFEVPVQEIHAARVLLTLVEGVPVYRAPEF